MSASQMSQGRAGAAAQIATSTDGNLYPSVRAGQFNLRSKSNVFINRHMQVVQLNSQTLPASAIEAGGGFSDIRVQGINPIAAMHLVIEVTNETKVDTSPMFLSHILSWINHVDLVSGSTVIQQLQPEHLARNMNLNQQPARDRNKSAYLGGARGDSTVVQAGQVSTHYFNLGPNWITENHICTAGLNQAIIARVWWNPVTTWGVGLAAVPSLTITNFSMLCQTVSFPQDRLSQIVSRYQSQVTDCRFAGYGYQKSIEQVTAGIPYTLRLASINGMITSALVFVKDLTYSSLSAQPIKNVDLLNSSGQSIMGSFPIPDLYRQTCYLATQSVATLEITDPTYYAYQIPFSPAHSDQLEEQGGVPGYIIMNGQHQLRFTSDQNGQFEVCVIYNVVNTASINRGVVTVSSS